MTKLMTKKDVADALQVSTRTVERILRDGGLVPVPVRAQIRFRPQDVEAFVLSLKGKSPSSRSRNV